MIDDAIYLKINEYIFDASHIMHPVMHPPWLCLPYIHVIHCYLPTPLEEVHHQVDLCSFINMMPSNHTIELVNHSTDT